MRNKTFKFLVGMYAGVAVFVIAFWVAVIYVAWHFISKFW